MTLTETTRQAHLTELLELALNLHARTHEATRQMTLQNPGTGPHPELGRTTFHRSWSELSTQDLHQLQSDVALTLALAALRDAMAITEHYHPTRTKLQAATPRGDNTWAGPGQCPACDQEIPPGHQHRHYYPTPTP